MVIRLDDSYNAMTSTALLGYVGETNARPVTIEGMEIDGADRYILTIDYGDGVAYEVDITGGQWTPTADILWSAQTVSCQIAAKKLSGDEYILVKKSRIFRLRIGAAIGDNAVPSPDVSMDALDRIDAIGRQAHADMQTAVTAADTATTAAENAAKSATAAGVSADTATQAASRAETAQTAAETSATQAETAMQGAENARQQAVTAQNNAKISADLAASAAQQTTADKTATAGYAQTAKTNADSTAADRQAVTDMAAQVTADKATVADNAAQVATDRTAAENAAQTAQSIADSLPDDYITAVGKIAENTAEIGRVKLTDKELTRRVNALYDMGNGVTHRFETDTETAYAKAVPSGGKLMSVKNVGGKSVVFNQLCSDFTYGGTKFNCKPMQSTHKYLCKIDCDAEQSTTVYMYFREVSYTQNNQTFKTVNTGKSTLSWITSPYGDSDIGGVFDAFVTTSVKVTFSNRQIFDLTAMFGAGNEPTSVEEFEKMFPADYYPYNAGEVVSAGVERVVEQGKNIWNLDGYTASDLVNHGYGYYAVKLAVKPNTTYCISVVRDSQLAKMYAKITGATKEVFFGHISNTGMNVYAGHPITFQTADNDYVYVELNSIAGFDTWKSNFQEYFPNFQIEESSTPTAYAPYHRNAYPIPEAIRNLPGYGWSAGTARNYVDYENKKYYQCVNAVDLGTLDWTYDNMPFGWGDNQWFSATIDSIKIIPVNTQIANVLCEKYTTRAAYVADKNDFFDVDKSIGQHQGSTRVTVLDKSYTDATAFKQAVSGVMLYYELATPIVTDISDLIPDDFLRNISVEAGGSITFKGSNDDYRIPVPSEEEYVVKLSEVGGSV